MKKENLASRLRASPWTGLFARVLVLASALAVLAWIGRVATANANAPPPPLLSASDAEAPPASASVSAAAPAPVADAPGAVARGRASAEAPVFLNSADETELRRLPGCGPKRAAAIVQLRRRVGRFHRIEELMRVKGIGRAAIKKWRPLVRLEEASDGGVAR